MYKYELDNIKYGFTRITTQDALKVKNAMFILAKDNSKPSDLEYANNIIDNLAIKYLALKMPDNNELSGNITFDLLESVFSNELAIIEISAKFMEHIKVFLNALPNFRQQ